MKKIEQLPLGFGLSGVKAGIKYKDRYDLALVYSNTPCRASGVWTKNAMSAACISYNKNHIDNEIHAIMINSGCANACTGDIGYDNCIICAKELANKLSIQSTQILLASTGVIGTQLPMDRISKGINKLSKNIGSNKKHIKKASKAILTTDTCTKIYGVEIKIGNHIGKIFGIAKGSGMIHPNMATMLGFIMTDIDICQNLLQEALKSCVDDSFNQISVDGDTSTNDMVIALSNGNLNNKKIVEKDESFLLFKTALNKVCTKLAKKIARDGEGANTLIQAHIKGAESKDSARKFSKSIISSNLVKAAIFGKDANWGRIICAMGYSGEFDFSNIDLHIESKHGKVDIIKNGVALEFDNGVAAKILNCDKVNITVDLKNGEFEARAWGCDLSYDYVKINADYRS